MFRTLFIYFISLFFMSNLFANNHEWMDLNVSTSLVTKGTLEGTYVPDPLDSKDIKVLVDDFMYFTMELKNNSSESIIISSITAKIVDANRNNNESVLTYIPQTYKHCSKAYPDKSISGRYFAHLNKEDSVVLGNFDNSIFYIDSLKENETFGGYKVEVELTVFGYITAVKPSNELVNSCSSEEHKAPSRDPLIHVKSPFKKKVFFTIN